MHGDRDYLEFLQESTFIDRAHVSAKPVVISNFDYVTEEELRADLDGIFENEESLDDFIYTFVTEDVLIELNTGAIKSMKHLLGVMQKKYDASSTGYGGGADQMKAFGKIQDLKRKIAALEKGGKDMADTAKQNVTDKAGEIADKAKEAAGDVGSKVSKAAEKVGGAVSKAGEYISQNPGNAAAIAAGAAAAIGAGVLAYKKFFSKGAKACKNAPDKKECMKDIKKKAVGARIAAMSAGKAKCAGNEKCAAKIDAKIAALKSKMASI